MFVLQTAACLPRDKWTRSDIPRLVLLALAFVAYPIARYLVLGD